MDLTASLTVVVTVQLGKCLLNQLDPTLVAIAAAESLEWRIAVFPPRNVVVNDDVDWQTMLVHLDAVDALLVDFLLLEHLHDALGPNSKFS